MGLVGLYLLFRDRLGLKRPNPRSFGLSVNTALINGSPLKGSTDAGLDAPSLRLARSSLQPNMYGLYMFCARD